MCVELGAKNHQTWMLVGLTSTHIWVFDNWVFDNYYRVRTPCTDLPILVLL